MSDNSLIKFASQEWGGYDTNQVNEYVRRITEEYKSLRDKYESLSDVYNKRLVTVEPTDTTAAVKAEQETSCGSDKAIREAKAEATRIIEKAYMDREKVEHDKNRLIDEIIMLLNWLKRDDFH